MFLPSLASIIILKIIYPSPKRGVFGWELVVVKKVGKRDLSIVEI